MSWPVHRKWAGALAATVLMSACGNSTPTVAPASAVSVPASAAAGGSPALGGSSSAPTGGSSGGSVRIVLVGFQGTGAFWQAVSNGAQQAGTDLGVSVQFVAPQTPGDEGMISLAQEAIATKPDGMVIDYNDHSLQDVTLQAVNAGIPVVLFNNNRFEAGGPGGATTDPKITSLPFVGQDEHQSGVTLADAFLPYVKQGGGTILIVNPFPTAYVATLRADAVTQTAQAAGYKTDVLVVKNDAGQIQNLVGAYLDAHSDVVGIIGTGAPGADPVADLMKTRGGTAIPIACFDVNASTIAHIQAGLIQVALFQQQWLQGYLGVTNLVMKLRYGFQPTNINTGTFLATKDNVNDLVGLTTAGRN